MIIRLKSAMRMGLCVVLTSLFSHTVAARVVINEIMYNAPEDLEDLEYIELHNTADEAVDLSGWSFTKGLKFKFPSGTKIESKGYLVLCQNQERFQQHYDAPISATFAQKLSNNGEKIELSDGSGKVVDAVSYKDSAPWPRGADGFSGSLERISPDAKGEDPTNWASSPLSPDQIKPAGTPGKPNASYSAAIPPIISSVKHSPQNPTPGESIAVEAEIKDAAQVKTVNLLYRVAGPGFEKEEQTVAMKATSEGRYTAQIPGQEKDHLIRFRVQAIGSTGAARFLPAENDPRPAYSAYVPGPIEPAKIPFGWIITPSESEFKAAQQRARSGGGRRGGPDPVEMARMQSRAMLESGIDLAGAWFELTVNHPSSLADAQKLKPVFAAKLSDRNKLVDDFLESENIEEKMGTIPDVIKTFQGALAEALEPQLNAEQRTAYKNWLEKQQQQSAGRGMFRGGPEMMIKFMANLEEAWYAVSVKAEIDEARFRDQRAMYKKLIEERQELIKQAATAMQREDGFNTIRQGIESIDEKLVSNMKTSLSPAQDKQFQDWRDNRMTFGRGPRGGRRPGGGGGGSSEPSHLSAFIYYDPATKKVDLYDFVQVVPRQGGHKIKFQKDQPLKQMTSINLLFENDFATMVEPLAYEVYRKVGMAAEQSFHVRLWLNGTPIGYHALVEQPNRAFLRRNKIRDDGNLYKLLWYEQGVVRQHEKKTNTREGHDDIVKLVEALEKTSGEEQWQLIQKHFDVEQVANYFAVNMVLSHWDGYFNNYFTYHDVKGTGKWTMYPWDQDQTWGIVMGGGGVFHDMPINFGMNGAVPPGGRRASRRGDGFGGNGPMWWRPPGYFSGPLLANPEFRKVFLKQTHKILDTVYKEEVFLPVIKEMGDRLRPEVKLRAELQKRNPESAVAEFEEQLEALREHLKKRREYLLADEEVKSVAAAK